MPTCTAFKSHLHRLRSAKIDARNFYASRIEADSDIDLNGVLRSLYSVKAAEIELLDLILLEAEEIE